MTNNDITKIYFCGDEIAALYQGSTLIFKKSGVVPPSPTGVYTVRGTLKPDSTEQTIQLCVNGINEQIDINEDKTFEHTFVNVPVTNMNNFTLACQDELKTIDLTNFDTSQVTSMVDLFYQCSNLETIDLTNVYTSNVTDMTRIFGICSGLKSLDVSNFDTSKVTNMSYMFYSCNRLETLDLSNFDTSNVTDMGGMFNYGGAYSDSYSQGLTSLDISNFNTSKVTRMNYMFANHRKLTDLYINFDVRSIKDDNYNYDGIFYNCSSLENVVGKFEGAKTYLSLSYCPLTAASAMVFINGLATVTGTRTLKLSETTYDSLTPEQIAIATAKGWTVTRS